MTEIWSVDDTVDDRNTCIKSCLFLFSYVDDFPELSNDCFKDANTCKNGIFIAVFTSYRKKENHFFPTNIHYYLYNFFKLCSICCMFKQESMYMYMKLFTRQWNLILKLSISLSYWYVLCLSWSIALFTCLLKCNVWFTKLLFTN